MNFNRHFQQEGKHALLGASQWRWLNDDPESLANRICSKYAPDIGTILHNVAAKHIQYRVKLNKYDKKNIMLELLSSGVPGMVIDILDFDMIFENLMNYVNDAISFRMHPEVVLYYSDNIFGTADAIAYNTDHHFLRVHDLKTGVSPAYMEQLFIYSALFCLEYRVKPQEIDAEFRIYQRNEILIHNPGPDEILEVMNKVVDADNFIKQHLQEG